SVLTRPSSISGNPVTWATSVTGSPASCRARADPPVEISATPCDTSPRANVASPVLSLTEIRARRIGRGASVITADPVEANGARCRTTHGARQHREHYGLALPL